MPCLEWESGLSAYADGELEGSEEKLAVKSHLENCAACRQDFQVLRILKDAVREVKTPPMPLELKTAIRIRAAAVPPAANHSAPWFIRPARRYAFASGLALACMGVVVGYGISTRDEPVPVDVLLAAHGRYNGALRAP